MEITNLIQKLNEYDYMTPDVAKLEFEKSLYHEDGNKYIVLGDRKNYSCFSYTFMTWPWTYTELCYRCACTVQNNKCYGCGFTRELRLTNHTGIPLGNLHSSKFYTHKKDDCYCKTLIIVQILPNVSIIDILKLEETISLRFKKWLDCYDAILTLKHLFILPLEIRNYIIEYLAEL
jgi:hypothetical protein